MYKKFAIAVSFPGEHRTFVEGIAQSLAGHLSYDEVFYDKWYEHVLARPNSDTYLQDIYLHKTELDVVFICKEYNEKEWCGLEWRAIRQLIKSKNDDMLMLVRVDNSDALPPGIFSTDISVSAFERPIEEVATLIMKRLMWNRKQTEELTTMPTMATSDNTAITYRNPSTVANNEPPKSADPTISQILDAFQKAGRVLTAKIVPSGEWISLNAEEGLENAVADEEKSFICLLGAPGTGNRAIAR
ncbi:MAG: TIR domain-containing protein [Planctomycetaceae bacterium]